MHHISDHSHRQHPSPIRKTLQKPSHRLRITYSTFLLPVFGFVASVHRRLSPSPTLRTLLGGFLSGWHFVTRCSSKFCQCNTRTSIGPRSGIVLGAHLPRTDVRVCRASQTSLTLLGFLSGESSCWTLGPRAYPEWRSDLITIIEWKIQTPVITTSAISSIWYSSSSTQNFDLTSRNPSLLSFLCHPSNHTN